ncbi:MAG: sulfatase [Bryobacterales bacterium]|nr:sulfatase [Bryobacterales bacterium]
MNRRTWLGLMGTAAIAAAAPSRPSPPRPNVLMLIADDLNTWTGLQHEESRGLSPEVIRLGERGLVFQNAFCASPLCNPSRTATLTGVAPWRSGVYDNAHWWRPAMPDAITMPAYWRRHGYRAAGVGKVFHHTAGFNPPSEWDEFHTFRFDDPWDRPGGSYPEIPATPAPPYVPLNGLSPLKHEFDWGSLPKPEHEYGDSRSVAWAEDYLSREQSQPFFLALGLFRPHLPWYSPPEYFRMAAAAKYLPPAAVEDLDDLPAEGRRMAAAGASDFERSRDAGKLQDAVDAYRASIRYADALFGRVLAALESGPHAEDTIVVLWSDNGFHLGEKQRFHKSTLWERACRVPLVVAAPWLKPGIVDCPVSLLDLYPTLTTLCGLPKPPAMDGQDLGPLIANPKQRTRRLVLTGFRPGNYAVSDGTWRYLRYHDGGEELYRLTDDSNEWNNLASDPRYRGRIRAMARALPRHEAQPAPDKSAYRFHPATYQWQRTDALPE